jgi:hypothetical protein
MKKILDRQAANTKTVLLLLASVPRTAVAQDYITVDPQHYKLELENTEMRVIRCKYGPREKSGILRQPNRLAVFFTDFHVRITLPDGKSREVQAQAGETRWGLAETHSVENLSDEPMELLIIESKKTPRK